MAAAAKKEDGAAFFAAGQYESALRCWTEALAAVEGDGTLAGPLHSNAAEACLRLGKWRRAATHATEALGADGGNVKARLRRCKALERLGDKGAALDDALALEAAADTPGLARALAPILGRLKRHREETLRARYQVPSAACPTLAAALAEAAAFQGPRGAVVALEAGVYEAVALRAAARGPLVVVGDRSASPRDVIIKRVTVASSDVTLSHVGVLEGAAVTAGARRVEISDCVLTHVRGTALDNAGDLRVTGSVVQHCADGIRNRGTLVVEATTLKQCDGTALVNEAGGDASLERCHVRDCGATIAGACALLGENAVEDRPAVRAPDPAAPAAPPATDVPMPLPRGAYSYTCS